MNNNNKLFFYFENSLNKDILYNILSFLGPNQYNINFHKSLDKILFDIIIIKFYNYYKKNFNFIKRKNKHTFF